MALKLMIITRFIYVLSFQVPTLYLLYNVELRIYWLKENEKEKEDKEKKKDGGKRNLLSKYKFTQRHCPIHKFSPPEIMQRLLPTQNVIAEFLFELNIGQLIYIKLRKPYRNLTSNFKCSFCPPECTIVIS